jgi:hypothetical protein
MHVFINDREVGALEATGATVGEMIEALGVHVDPDEIVTGVELDGVAFSAGEEERWSRRPASSVAKLVLATATPAAFAQSMRVELAAALDVIAAKVDLVVERFARGEDRDANALLAALMEELRLALVLEQQVTTLDGVVVREAAEPVAAVAPALLEAQERRRWTEVGELLVGRLAPALRGWSGAERAVVASAAPNAI